MGNQEGYLVDASAIGLVAEFAIRIVFIRNNAIIGHGFDLLEQFGGILCVFGSGFFGGKIELSGCRLRLAEFFSLPAEDFRELSGCLGTLLRSSCEIKIFHTHVIF